MINPQYTYDKEGKKVGVFLTIEDWDQLEKIPEVDKLSSSEFVVPEWQIELGRKELKKIADGTARLMEWNEAKKLLKL